MNPPLRSAVDRQATIAAIADGTVDLLATDHAPHTLEEKERGFLEAPNGIIGLECAYGVCHKVLVDGGYISDQRLIELMSVAPSRLMGHRPTDVAALLNVTAPCASKRTLDLSAVEHPENVDLAILNTSEAWTVDPEKFLSKPATRPSADGMSPGVRWRPSSAPRWYSAAFTDGRFEPARKPAVSGGTDT